MSIRTAISKEEARRKAEEVVRFELGTFARLGSGEYDNEAGAFRFPLVIRSPRIITAGRENAVEDVRFLSELELGEVTVDGTDGEVDRPNRTTIRRKIREHKDEIEIAVQKALVSAAGRQLSHLPFPENQYSPLQDILSELLLRGEISMDRIEMMDENRNNDRYQEYIENLIELDLATRDGRIITNGDVLIGIEQDTDRYQEALNAAMGRYFENNLSEFQMIKRTLGPYLVIAGYYYRRSLELEEMPVVEEQELRRAIESEYSGREREEKLMKVSRYLIQLEDVGILQSLPQNGTRYWVGDESVKARLREQSDYLAPLETLMSQPA